MFGEDQPEHAVAGGQALEQCVIGLVLNYRTFFSGPRVTLELLRDGHVGVALSVLYSPFAEMDLAQHLGALLVALPHVQRTNAAAVVGAQHGNGLGPRSVDRLDEGRDPSEHGNRDQHGHAVGREAVACGVRHAELQRREHHDRRGEHRQPRLAHDEDHEQRGDQPQ